MSEERLIQAWAPDERFRVATTEESDERKCRHPRCGGRPVVAMARRCRTRHGTFMDRWYLYCEKHQYGRRVMEGVVEHLVWRPVEAGE